MTKAERAQVLEEARKLCLEVAERARVPREDARRLAGVNSAGFNAFLGIMEGATDCAAAIEEAKEET